MIGSGKFHHFFGYYNKSPWDENGLFVLAHRTKYMTANLTPELTAEIGYFDLENDDKFNVIGETSAWNWQMGAQLQWLESEKNKELIYNVRTGDLSAEYSEFGSRVYNLTTGKTRKLPLPIYVVAPNAQYALCLNYHRLYLTHQTIGYSSSDALATIGKAPSDDGIHLMDVKTGFYELILSYQDLRKFHPLKSMVNAMHWVSHIEINCTSSRVLFLHRWTERVEDETCFLHRLITMNPDGSDLRLLECSDHPLPQLKQGFNSKDVGTFDYEKSEYQISHPIWIDDSHIIAWSPHEGNIHYHIYTDANEVKVEVVGQNILTENGHMSFSEQNERWLLSDTYPDDNSSLRSLIVYDMEQKSLHKIGEFYTPTDLGKENRCDLHPRWSHNGKQVCIDSVHKLTRQMYIIDVNLDSDNP